MLGNVIPVKPKIDLYSRSHIMMMTFTLEMISSSALSSREIIITIPYHFVSYHSSTLFAIACPE